MGVATLVVVVLVGAEAPIVCVAAAVHSSFSAESTVNAAALSAVPA